MAQPPVELHIVSDSTGETAARLVLALEAQFPEQAFEEVRHTRAETVDDLERAVASARGHAAVVIYTLVDPELRDAMRRLCRRARVHYCDLLGHPIDAVARVSGQAARMTPGSRAPLTPAYFRRIEAMEFAVKYDDGVGAGLDEAAAVQRRLGCPVIDISELSIEETAQRILRTVEGRKAEAAAPEAAK